MEQKGDGRKLLSPFAEDLKVAQIISFYSSFESQANALRRRLGRLWNHTLFKKEFASKWVCEWNEEEKVRIVTEMKETLQGSIRSGLINRKDETPGEDKKGAGSKSDAEEAVLLKEWEDAIWLAIPELESAPHVAKVMGEWKNVEEILSAVIAGLESADASTTSPPSSSSSSSSRNSSSPHSRNNPQAEAEAAGTNNNNNAANERQWDITASFFVYLLRRKGLSNITELPDAVSTLFESVWRPFRALCVTSILWNLLNHVVANAKDVEEKLIAEEGKESIEESQSVPTLLSHLQSMVRAEEQKNLLVSEWIGEAHKDESKVALITRLADIEDHPIAQFYLAGYYARGRGGSPDAKKAVDYLTKAANQGHVSAQEEYAILSLEGSSNEGGRSKELSRAKHWFEKAANGGSLKAQYHLGTLYAQENNYFVANMWLEKAASNWHWDPSDESTVEAARLELRAMRKTILRLLNSQAPQQTSSTPSVQQKSSKQREEKEREESFLPEHLLKKQQGKKKRGGKKGKRGGGGGGRGRGRR